MITFFTQQTRDTFQYVRETRCGGKEERSGGRRDRERRIEFKGNRKT